MSEALPRQFSIGGAVLALHVAVLIALLLPFEIGLTLRLFLEQGPWVLALFITNTQRPDELVLVLHLIALTATLFAAWFWRTGHAWLPRGLLVAGIANLLVAPVGLAPGALMIWLSRRPGFWEAFDGSAPLAGRPRLHFGLKYGAGVIIMCIAAVPIFTMFELLFFGWFLAIPLLGALPALPVLLAMTHKERPEHTLHAMPPLPEPSRR